MINTFNKINNKLSNAKSLIRYIPIVMKSANGIYITDINNKKYIDCIGSAGTIPLGHNHKVINTALSEFANGNYPVQTMDIPTELQIKFTDKLYDFLPQSFSNNAKIQMCSPSGGDAVDAAIKLAKIATGRNTILSFQGGYHGQGFGAASVSAKIRGGFTYAGMPDVHFLPYPNNYRCPFSNSGVGHHKFSEYVKDLIENPQSGIGKPAAVILETVQGEGGINIAPIEWLKKIRYITEKNDIPLIIDEVQTGFCRTGKKFSFEHANIVPDMVCLAKAMGGSMPIAALLHNEKLDKWTEYQHSGTWRGNQIAFLTGLRCMEYMEEKKLWKNSEYIGKIFYKKLSYLQQQFPIIGDVRGKGLMLAIEIVDESYNNNIMSTVFPPAPVLAEKLQNECLNNGLLILRGGPYKNVIRIMPPLNITMGEVEQIIDIIKKSLQNITYKDPNFIKY